MAEPMLDPVTTGLTLEVDSERVAWIRFNDTSRTLNVLTEQVMHDLDMHLDEVHALRERNEVRALVFRSGKPNSFIAGADVRAIGGIENPEEGRAAAAAGQAIYQKIATLPFPTVSAIHGICLGGGTELSLACRFRIASDSPKTKFGLPEVQLGILPAWGGTTRLPRLVGLQAALDLLLTGKQLDAKRALRKGLVDAVVPAELFQDEVEAFVRDRLAGAPVPTPKRPLLTRLLDGTAPGRAVVMRQAKKRVMAQTGGHYPAALRILEVAAGAMSGPVEASLAREAEAAGELIPGTVSKNLMHVFHMREAARKGSGQVDLSLAGQVNDLGIIGAGVMGGGIAQLGAYNTIRVRVKDIRHEAVGGALQHARSLFQKAVKRRKLDRRVADQRMELITGGLNYGGFAQADVVVEAVVERMDVKQAVLKEVEEIVQPGAVLTSNTSSLSIDTMASALARPDQFGGMHFFNPVHRMPLVEVVRGAATSEATTATIYALALRMGKIPVVVEDGSGFLVNRILGPYLNEAGYLLGDRVSVEDIDRAAKKFGMPMGPVRLLDEVGLDIARHAGEALYEAFGERMKPSPVLASLANSDRLGRKGGLGFYRYEGDKEAGVDDAVYADVGLGAPGGDRSVKEAEITERLVLTMINEAARILDDGIVKSAADVDLGMIMGTGFPPFRGGLLRYSDSLHTRTVLGRLTELHESLGERFEPAPLLVTLAKEDRDFYAAFPAASRE